MALVNVPFWQGGVFSLTLPGGPIGVEYEVGDDPEWGVVVADPESGMFGEGPTLEAAISDLKEHFIILRDGLTEDEDRLADDLRPDLARLRRLFPVTTKPNRRSQVRGYHED